MKITLYLQYTKIFEIMSILIINRELYDENNVTRGQKTFLIATANR